MAQAEEIRTETGPLDYDYTEKEVELCQENLQNHKACSPDKIKNEMLKYGGTRIVSFLTVQAMLRSRFLIIVVSVDGLQPFFQLRADSAADSVLVEWALALELLQQKQLQGVLPLLVGPNADRSREQPAFLQPHQEEPPERVPDVVVGAVVQRLTELLREAKLTPCAELKTCTVCETYRQLMAHGRPRGEDVAANLLSSKRARGDAVSLVDIPLLSLKLARAMDDVRVAESQEPAEVTCRDKLLKDEKAQQQLALSTATRVEAKHVAFLSHAQAQAGDAVRTIFLELDRKCWYDKEQVERTLIGMVKGIAMSEVFLIYLSKAYFTRPYCRFELQVARLLGKPLVVVREASERLNRGPITFAQIEACNQQLLGYDILAFTDEMRDAFSTGFIPLLKARINIALGRESHQSRSTESRPLDLVVFAATGDVGSAACRFLYHHGRTVGIHSWAPAARDLSKLKQLVQEPLYAAAPFNQDSGVAPNEPIRADLSDMVSMQAMARQARVVLATAGPYQKSLQAASGGGGQLSQGQLDALKAVELVVETLANISDEDLEEIFKELSVSALNKARIKAAKKILSQK
eukprot:g21602.t1